MVSNTVKNSIRMEGQGSRVLWAFALSILFLFACQADTENTESIGSYSYLSNVEPEVNLDSIIVFNKGEVVTLLDYLAISNDVGGISNSLKLNTIDSVALGAIVVTSSSAPLIFCEEFRLLCNRQGKYLQGNALRGYFTIRPSQPYDRDIVLIIKVLQGNVSEIVVIKI